MHYIRPSFCYYPSEPLDFVAQAASGNVIRSAFNSIIISCLDLNSSAAVAYNVTINSFISFRKTNFQRKNGEGRTRCFHKILLFFLFLQKKINFHAFQYLHRNAWEIFITRMACYKFAEKKLALFRWKYIFFVLFLDWNRSTKFHLLCLIFTYVQHAFLISHPSSNLSLKPHYIFYWRKLEGGALLKVDIGNVLSCQSYLRRLIFCVVKTIIIVTR